MRYGAVLLMFLLVLGSCAGQRTSDRQIGMQQLKEGAYRDAIASFERDLLRHPENYESQCLIGQAQEKLNDPEAALKSYARTIALNPVNACAFIGFGRIYAAQKRWTEAWDAFLQARGVEANDALLAAYPALRAAVDAGEWAVAAPAVTVPAPTVARTVIVSVRVTPATLKTRPVIAITAAPYGPQNTFEAAFAAAIAATAGDRITRCHDLFYAAGGSAALDASFTLMLRSDGTVDEHAEASQEPPADMKDCVLKALATVRFPALPGTD